MSRTTCVTIIFILLAGILATFAYSAYKTVKQADSEPATGAATSTISQNATSTVTNTKITSTSTAALKTYQNGTLTLKNVPVLFSVSSTMRGFILTSDHSVTDNPSGIPGKEIIHPFRVTIERVSSSLLATIKQQAGSSTFAILFPKGTLASFNAEEGFSATTTVNGKIGYEYTAGIEGINETYVFVSQDATHTIKITLSWIGDFLSPSIKETDQKNLFAEVLRGLTF